MSKINFLKQQIIESREFSNRLISEIPQDLWYTIPENTNSNFIWQIGHLLVAQNFHSITVITGLNKTIADTIPILKYNKIFNGMGSLQRSIEKDLIPPKRLKEEFDLVHEICLENLNRLNDEILIESLEPIPFKHPIANTKYEALSWSFKHEMWHCAEMEDIKRTLGHPIKWM